MAELNGKKIIFSPHVHITQEGGTGNEFVFVSNIEDVQQMAALGSFNALVTDTISIPVSGASPSIIDAEELTISQYSGNNVLSYSSGYLTQTASVASHLVPAIIDNDIVKISFKNELDINANANNQLWMVIGSDVDGKTYAINLNKLSGSVGQKYMPVKRFASDGTIDSGTWKAYPTDYAGDNPTRADYHDVITAEFDNGHLKLYKGNSSTAWCDVEISTYGLTSTFFGFCAYYNTSTTKPIVSELTKIGNEQFVTVGKGDIIQVTATDGNITAVSIEENINGRGISNIAKSGDIWTITYTDGTTQTITETFDEMTVDLIVFAGQSNMAGRDTHAYSSGYVNAPNVDTSVAQEFCAISAYDSATGAYVDPLKQIGRKVGSNYISFGQLEDNVDGINDGNRKRGGLVPAFCNAYFANRGVKIIGVSASEGGTSSADWLDTTSVDRISDLKARYNAAKTWLIANGYTIRRKFIVWLQGESDGDDGITSATYVSNIRNLFENNILGGNDPIDAEKVLIIRIGYRMEVANEALTGNVDTTHDYTPIILGTNKLCGNSRYVMISKLLTEFAEDAETYYKTDGIHFNQTGLNAVGTDAGYAAGLYANTNVEPIPYDIANLNAN